MAARRNRCPRSRWPTHPRPRGSAVRRLRQQTTERLPTSCQQTTERLPTSCQQTTERLPAARLPPRSQRPRSTWRLLPWSQRSRSTWRLLPWSQRSRSTSRHHPSRHRTPRGPRAARTRRPNSAQNHDLASNARLHAFEKGRLRLELVTQIVSVLRLRSRPALGNARAGFRRRRVTPNAGSKIGRRIARCPQQTWFRLR